MRPPSSRCTWWSVTSCSPVAEYSRTGTLTSPKATEPFQIARMVDAFRRWRVRPGAPAARVSAGGRAPRDLLPAGWTRGAHARHPRDRSDGAPARVGVVLRGQVGRRPGACGHDLG